MRNHIAINTLPIIIIVILLIGTISVVHAVCGGTYTLRGTPPFCNGQCEIGEENCGNIGGCLTGQRSKCSPVSEGPFSSCHWRGTAPFCNGECRSGESRIGSISKHWRFDAGATTLTGHYYSTEDKLAFGNNCATGAKAYCCGIISSRRETVKSATPLECKPGLVWREACRNDYVCVPPVTRSQAAEDNRLASSRIQSRGRHGSDTCITGFVWREACPSDHVCVTPETYRQALRDNELAHSRVREK